MSVPKPRFVDIVRDKLEQAGIGDADLVLSEPESMAFGDTAAVFRIAPLLLRFVRDRGQQFVELAAEAEPGRFHYFEDVSIGMGWRSVDDVMAMPEPIDAILRRVRTNRDYLNDALSGNQARLTRARIEKAARDRGEFTVRLLGKQ
jgi:hypothetical protein